MTADAGAVEPARAKVNLFLHVVGRRADGYHELESLAVFPGIGDLVRAVPAPRLTLDIEGPFAEGLSAGEDNLVLRAASALGAATPGRPAAALRLVKRLPVAAGLGGGSADSGAVLRVLARIWPDAPVAALPEIAARLGADAPVCLASEPALMAGAGERLTPAPGFRGFWVVLVNPMQPLSTAEVFAGLEQRERPDMTPPPDLADFDALTGWLAGLRNDLEEPARRLRPTIGEALAALSSAPACRLARMSGSGATCFGMFETGAQAAVAAKQIGAARRGWWVVAAPVERWKG
ncbi:4-(cytidine 5'-diphospho)-2-C-methyl-D-erythritol kinase [Pikeienuella piscinae]|uniref:4-diphosphocytidyl-2-C-methyl-D-erythritol kinase n=1 Tax=Pikeienuella piscinae TaxID=2748098 RepID=A0A7L5BU74_9RHOB|nr:4-(cytidine 5'-diphospho)-2-C-methyl-D-erythritol kinase [Pikeienuella piscinae]QIE55780.1 4-(cytidine 5'-diphospho)-2-C-methyl-D-erythritol kinase [Pikeienuella piscinae]